MESNKFSSSQEVGGYSTQNLTDTSIFFANPDKQIKLSFKIDNIELIEDSEIMKIKLSSSLIVRLMKYSDGDQVALIFDIVDDVKKEIVNKVDKLFYGGIGVGGFLMKHSFLPQWEVLPFDKISRAFVMGDKAAFTEATNHYNIKLSQSADWYIRNELD